MLPDTLKLEVVTPEREVASETVTEVQLPGLDGYLGILPGHAPLLTELGIGELTYRQGKQTMSLTVLRGFAEVLPDRVVVLAEVSERPEEIDVERARNARERAEKRLAGAEGKDMDWDRVTCALKRALVRLEVAAKSAKSGEPDARRAA